ncbi:sn-glycerol-3-phosphate ABC transporter ATP-binding protein UgpC [Falsiroseomonas bella]|uniref:sn-glycerol-3-phosphate ABC transporter ATP-binding protein UgpC n=1 Tax=Falsiroseomonas bella TaxID=2184016 RepID=A0A317F8N5_9PROT|nr:sn-glycerol-3-phosphate ABC transporter ATP-binding protein UgpC [Falsiroseomonas bella]PWS34842.1 sn-glycerol-3-phosphate ABC transporter ATP-binding protein UgpC [Falsiroseomonas bella]
MATLTLSAVKKQFGATQVLHGIDLDVADGEMIVVVGASGCGKSTLLRIVAGLETPSSGAVLIDGRDVTRLEPADRDIAMVFQNYALYPHMSVFDNMAYGLRIRGMPTAEIRRRVGEAAEMLEISQLLDRKPRQLSGGQRQRVAMGRAVVREPKLFLFDEPLSNLDAKLRVQMRAEIRRLQKRLGVTSLFVTHDQVEAMTLGDRLVVMHQGRAAQVASPMEVWGTPADTYVAGFIGSPAMNFLAASISDAGRSASLKAGPTLPFADGARAGADGSTITIGIRPEHVEHRPDGADALPLAVELVEPLGSETVIHGRLPGGESLVARLPIAAGHIGETLPVRLPPEAWHVFSAEGVRLPARAAVPA